MRVSKPCVLALIAAWSSEPCTAQVPAVYQDLYTQLNGDLNDFQQAITVSWNGSKYPVKFAGQLTAANANNGPGLLQPSSFTLIQNEILLLKAIGVKAVSVEVSFPMLDAAFFTSIGQPAYQSQFTTFYANVASAIRAQGLQVIVESQSMIPSGLQSVWGAGLQNYYASLATFQAYESARAQTAAAVAQTMRPDYFVLQEEPDTESIQSTQSAAVTVSGSTTMLDGSIAAVRQANVPGMKIGAGFGSWLQAYQLFANSFTRQRCGQIVSGQAQPCLSQPLDFLDLHLYPINEQTVYCSPPPNPRPCTAPNFWQNALSILGTANAANVPMSISQTWLRKVRDTEWPPAGGRGDVQEAREAYGFWAPLDLSFLETVYGLANYGRMLFVAPFNTPEYSAYLTWTGGSSTCAVNSTPACTALEGEDGGNTPQQTFGAAQALGQTNLAAAIYSSVGIGYHNLVVADVTAPSDPSNVAALRTTPTTVMLSWSASTDDVGVAGYHVWRDGTPLADVFQSPVQDTGLSPASVYTYQVQAFDLAGNVSAKVTASQAGQTDLLLPVVLDTQGLGGSHYTTELTLASRAASPMTALLTYTASSGGGSGSTSLTLAPGEQRIVPDTIAFLRAQGLSIPSDANAKIGTLLVSFSGGSSSRSPETGAPSTAFAGARTFTADPAGGTGTFGLFYTAAAATTTSATLVGLQQNAVQRSNLAVVNAGNDGVTLHIALQGPNGEDLGSLPDTTLGPWGWAQFGQPLLGRAASGRAVVTRLSGTSPFTAYAVLNDAVTADGSFITALLTGLDTSAGERLVPIVLKNAYSSELTLANLTSAALPLTLVYRATAQPGFNPEGSGAGAVTLGPGEQRIYPDAIAFLRTLGVPIPDDGSNVGGSLIVRAAAGTTADGLGVLAQIFTSSGGGTFGVLIPGLTLGQSATSTAWIYGLQDNGTQRSNFAIVNRGDAADSITLRITYFSASGTALGAPVDKMLAPGEWFQFNRPLNALGATAGYAKVERTSGTSRFAAYGVLNDNVTSDGSYIPMSF